MKKNDVEKLALTKKSLAESLEVSVSTINNWMRDGRITPLRVGRRVLFPIYEVQRFLTTPKKNSEKRES